MITFTQFLRPDARKILAHITRPPDIEAMAAKLVAAGYLFEIEALVPSHLIHLEIIHRDDPDTPIADGICANGPAVPLEVDAVVKTAFAHYEACKRN